MIDAIDINADMGESFGPWRMGADEALLELVSSANVACGFHAGDPLTMRRTVRAARARGVAIGAHPGFQDLRGFGRRRILGVPEEELAADIAYQIGAMRAIARMEGAEITHVKLHGALANWASEDPELAVICLDAVARAAPELTVLAIAGTELERAARRMGLPVAAEVFADRACRADGTLVDRCEPGAMIHDPDEAADRVLRMVREGHVIAVDGTRLPVRPASICVHGDGPHALAIARRVRERLEAAGVRVRPFRDA